MNEVRSEEEYRRDKVACQASPGLEIRMTKCRPGIHLTALLAGVAVGTAAVMLGSLAIAYGSTHPIRRRIKGDPGDLGLDFEDVQFASADGLPLSGWFIPAGRAESTVILCHRFPNNMSDLLPC